MNLSGMFLLVSTGLESARDPGPSTATVDSDAARVIVQPRHPNRARAVGASEEHGFFRGDTLAALRRATP
jgi:hypothetical protein